MQTQNGGRMACRPRSGHHDSSNKVQGYIRGRTNVAVVRGSWKLEAAVRGKVQGSSGNIQIGRRKNVRQNERLAVSLKKLERVKLQPRGLV